VITGGEVLTSHMRHHIQEGFCVPVFDSYGSIEFNLLAWECQSTGEYHSCDDGMITEVLQDGVPVAEGERGDVVGTDLHSFAMPLIRYKLDDVVTKGLEVCRCGQPFSTIRSIQGRILDYFRLSDGRLVHPYEFPLGREKFPWIREFQIIQHSVDRIVMKIAPFQTPSSDGLRALLEPMKKLLGHDVTFEIELVSDIPREASGKCRVYRSFVQPG
jgi:phenylacetate-CoA ligase